MIIFVITQFSRVYSDYDSCGCGREERKDIEIFSTPEKAIERLKKIREEQEASAFQHEKDFWYDVRVKEIE